MNRIRNLFSGVLPATILISMIGFSPASFAGPIVLDSLRVDYVGGSYLEVIFDSTTIFEQGDHELLEAYFDPSDGKIKKTFSDTVVSSTLYSGFNSLPALTLITHPHPYFELQVDEFGDAWINFVIYGLTPANNKQVFAPFQTKYEDDDDWLNGLSSCVRETGCPVTADGYVLSVSPAPSEFTLTYEAGDNGSIIGESPQTVAYDADGSPVTADPDPNHHFVNWSDASTANPRTDANVKATIDVTANFAIDTFTVTPSVATGSGTITPDTEQTVDYNATQQFVLTAAPDSLIASVGGTCGGTLDAGTYTTDPVVNDCTVEANFAVKPPVIFNNGFEALPKIVFVSSAAYPGSLGGLDGADQTCNNLATAAELPGTYAAWLSTTSPAVNAKDRIGDHAWVRIDGAMVAENLADLTDGSLQNPINLDENGIVRDAVGVWTGTGSNGTFAGNGNPCNGWTGSGFGLRGTSAATSGAWTQNGGLLSCPNSSRIYCFGK